jgi:hypothetical protein
VTGHTQSAPTTNGAAEHDGLAAMLGSDLGRIRETLSALELAFATDGPRTQPANRVGLIEESGPDGLITLARARTLRRALFDAGLAWPDGPADLGGGGRPKAWSLALDQVLAGYKLPSRAQLVVGL